MNKLEDILEKARKMPPLSHDSMRLLEIIGNENHNLQDVVLIVESDPALTVQVLKVVNSVSYGLRQSVNSITRAVSLLGDKTILGIAIGQGSPEVFDSPLQGYESEQGELWAHGLRTAIASLSLAAMAREEVAPDLAYTAGILHDIGKSVLSGFMKDQAPELIEKINKGEVKDYLEAEEAVLGTNHCAVGGELAKQWNLPPPLCSAIQNHHTPFEAESQYRHLAFVIHLADIIAMMGGTGTGTDAMSYSLDERSSEFVAIDQIGIEKLLMNVMIEFEKTRSSLFGK